MDLLMVTGLDHEDGLVKRTVRKTTDAYSMYVLYGM